MDTEAELTGAGVALSGNHTDGRGGGLWVDDRSYVSLHDAELVGNVAARGGAGAAVRDEATLDLVGALVASNDALTGPGGGLSIELGGLLLLREGTVRDNLAGLGGGLSLTDGAEATVVDSAVIANTAVDQAGGMWFAGAHARVDASSFGLYELDNEPSDVTDAQGRSTAFGDDVRFVCDAVAGCD